MYMSIKQLGAVNCYLVRPGQLRHAKFPLKHLNVPELFRALKEN